MTARNLVTGATGFAGRHLVVALLAAGQEVVALSRREGDHGLGVPVVSCDVLSSKDLGRALAEIRPTHVYHLAGFAGVGESFKDPEAAWAGNLGATRALCEAVRLSGDKPRVLFAGSGLVYGDHDGAVDESCLLSPDTPYAASKAAADLACLQYARWGLDIVRARPFNHIGPGQATNFAVPNWARQIVAAERGGPAVIETGDLSTERDFTDVRDMVAAYLLLMQRGRGGEAYNIASGRTVSMRAVLESMLSLSTATVEVRQRDDLMRPTEQRAARVETGKLRRETGWGPRFTLERTLEDTLAAFRRNES